MAIFLATLMLLVPGAATLSRPPAVILGIPTREALSAPGPGAQPLDSSDNLTSPANAAPRDTAANVYAYTKAGDISPTVAGIPERVFVPNSSSNTVVVIDPKTLEVTDRFQAGYIPHHIAPAWDLSALYVDNEGSSSLTVLDPRTGKPKDTIAVPYPYNLYFTPDGTKAVVVVERLRRLDFRDPHNWQLLKSVPIPWAGADHLDFSADGRYLFVSTEYAGELVRVDTQTMEVAGTVHVGGLPVDVRLSPDGSVLYVANQGRHGVSVVDPDAMKEIAFIPTGLGAHGFALSRDTSSLYVSNRLAGTISVIDFGSRRVTALWKIGGSPDMLQVSPDGTQLWASGRFDGAVYVLDTGSGQLLKRIPVGPGAHGLTFFPNAGRYSLGHNGVYR